MSKRLVVASALVCVVVLTGCEPDVLRGRYTYSFVNTTSGLAWLHLEGSASDLDNTTIERWDRSSGQTEALGRCGDTFNGSAGVGDSVFWGCRSKGQPFRIVKSESSGQPLSDVDLQGVRANRLLAATPLHLLIADDEDHLWRLPRAGGAAVFVSSGAPAVAWGQDFYVLSLGGLYRIGPDSSLPTHLASVDGAFFSDTYTTAPPKAVAGWLLWARTDGAGLSGYRISDGTTKTWAQPNIQQGVCGVYPRLTAFTADETYVYWSDSFAERFCGPDENLFVRAAVFREALVGGEREELFSTQHVEQLEVDALYLYWIENWNLKARAK